MIYKNCVKFRQNIFKNTHMETIEHVDVANWPLKAKNGFDRK